MNSESMYQYNKVWHFESCKWITDNADELQDVDAAKGIICKTCLSKNEQTQKLLWSGKGEIWHKTNCICLKNAHGLLLFCLQIPQGKKPCKLCYVKNEEIEKLQALLNNLVIN